MDRGNLDGFAAVVDTPAVGPQSSGDYGDQRRFAGPVFAEQYMHLAPAEGEVDVAEGEGAGELLGYPL